MPDTQSGVPQPNGSIAATACVSNAACVAACPTASNWSPTTTHPPRPGPQPTLLMRQPYGRDIASTVVYAHPLWFAAPRIQRRHPGCARAGRFRRRLLSLSPRGARWRRNHRVAARAGPSANGTHRHVRVFLSGNDPTSGCGRATEGLVCIAPGMTASICYHGWFYHQGALRLASSPGLGFADAEGGRTTPATSRGE